MNKRGNSIVFLSIVMAALVGISLTLVYAARSQAVISFADGVFTLACDSVLSHYDYYVHEDYDLFLLNGSDSDLSDKFNRYAACSLDEISDYSNSHVSSARYCVADLDAVKQQILDYMEGGGLAETSLNHKASSDDPDGSDDSHNRTLRHGPTITGLPSRYLPDKSIIASAESLAENLKKPEAIFRSGTKKYMLDSYILDKFNNDLYSSHENHFFEREIEYIICGKLSDDENGRKTDRAILALRTGLNLSHIYSDPEKLAAVEAASQVITPGVFGTVTQAGIASAWAAAEAGNDVLLLHEGYKVPIVKGPQNWAIDLDGLIKGLIGKSAAVRPASNQGRKYEDYLRILLYIKDENVKTARILDLIQINMRKNHDENFLVGECATGISADCVINGHTRSYERIY